MKKKVIAGIIGVIAIVAITTGIAITNQKPKLTKDSITIEAGNEFKPEAKDFFSGKHVKDITFDVKDVDVDKVGEYKVSASYKKHSYEITVKVEDTTAPTITAKSEDPVYTKDVSAVNAEDYVTVEDVSDTTVAFTGYQKMDSLDAEPATEATATVPEEEGFYKATITATDSSDNKSEAEVILAYDKTAPVIEGLQDTTVESDPTEDQFNPTANDNLDGQVDVTKTLEKTGDNLYTITAKALDKAGNEATQTATITVQAPQPVAEAPAQESASTKATKKAGKGSGSGNASNSSSSSSSAGSQTAPAQQAPTEQPTAPEQQPVQEAPAQDDSASNAEGKTFVQNSKERDDAYYDKRAETVDFKCTLCGIDFGYGTSGESAFAEHMQTVHSAY